MAKKKTGSGVFPGNPMAEARAWAKRVHAYGLAVLKLDRLTDDELMEGRVMRSIKVTPPTNERFEWLVVVKGLAAGRKVVGFHSAEDPSEALRGAIEKYDNKSMKMREDRPFPPAE